MSYEIFVWRLPNETAVDCGCRSLLLEDTRKAWSMLTLKGVGEHEGTNHTISKQQLFQRRFDNDAELAAVLDREFLRAHAFRLSEEARTTLKVNQP